MDKHLVESFEEYFEVLLADTDELKNAVYRLRYEVFCMETGVWDPSGFPDGKESDEFDSRSEHCLIRHRKSGSFAASTRLVLPDSSNLDRPFPMETLCSSPFANSLNEIPRSSIAEISRFCIAPQFKRRHGEYGSAIGDGRFIMDDYKPCAAERRAWPHLTLGLIACLNRIVINHGYNSLHLYSFIEPSFFRLLNILGIYFTPIGASIQYHGKIRIPCIIKFPDYLENVKSKNIEVWDMLTDYGKLRF